MFQWPLDFAADLLLGVRRTSFKTYACPEFQALNLTPLPSPEGEVIQGICPATFAGLQGTTKQQRAHYARAIHA
jgi:hypothetical protein